MKHIILLISVICAYTQTTQAAHHNHGASQIAHPAREENAPREVEPRVEVKNPFADEEGMEESGREMNALAETNVNTVEDPIAETNELTEERLVPFDARWLELNRAKGQKSLEQCRKKFHETEKGFCFDRWITKADMVGMGLNHRESLYRLIRDTIGVVFDDGSTHTIAYLEHLWEYFELAWTNHVVGTINQAHGIKSDEVTSATLKGISWEYLETLFSAIGGGEAATERAKQILTALPDALPDAEEHYDNILVELLQWIPEAVLDLNGEHLFPDEMLQKAYFQINTKSPKNAADLVETSIAFYEKKPESDSLPGWRELIDRENEFGAIAIERREIAKKEARKAKGRKWLSDVFGYPSAS